MAAEFSDQGLRCLLDQERSAALGASELGLSPSELAARLSVPRGKVSCGGSQKPGAPIHCKLFAYRAICRLWGFSPGLRPLQTLLQDIEEFVAVAPRMQMQEHLAWQKLETSDASAGRSRLRARRR